MRIWDWSSDVCSSDLQSRPADLIAKSGPIAAVATATLVVVLLDLEERGVAIVGDITQSFPPFTMPLFDAGLWQHLAIPALLLSILGFVASVSVAPTLAAKQRQRIDPAPEPIALGPATLPASFPR